MHGALHGSRKADADNAARPIPQAERHDGGIPLSPTGQTVPHARCSLALPAPLHFGSRSQTKIFPLCKRASASLVTGRRHWMTKASSRPSTPARADNAPVGAPVRRGASSLTVVETQSSSAKPRLQNAILFSQERDQISLLAMKPRTDCHDDQLKQSHARSPGDHVDPAVGHYASSRGARSAYAVVPS